MGWIRTADGQSIRFGTAFHTLAPGTTRYFFVKLTKSGCFRSVFPQDNKLVCRLVRPADPLFNKIRKQMERMAKLRQLPRKTWNGGKWVTPKVTVDGISVMEQCGFSQTSFRIKHNADCVHCGVVFPCDTDWNEWQQLTTETIEMLRS